MKNLVIAFCSLRPGHIDQKTNDFREFEYLICLKQLIRMIPKNFDIQICDNTIDDANDISNVDLKLFLNKNNTFFTGSKNNIDTQNIGMGELLMLYNSLKNISLNEYNFICYLTARRYFTCPYVFEKTNNLQKDALISNPDFLFLNGEYRINPKKDLYNDMFFSMKAGHIFEYANFAYEIIQKKTKPFKFNPFKKNTLGSEQILFKYIKNKNLSFEYLNWLGMIRNDWRKGDNIFDINNFHIC